MIDFAIILNTVESPYTLDSNVKWILELTIPMALAILGWIFVYKLNSKNMKSEKKIHVKIQAYEIIKSDINDVVQSYGVANGTLFLTSNTLKNFTKDYILYDIDKKRLIEEQDNNNIRSLFYKANSDFVKFIFTWELYEIVFIDIVRERYALQCEYDELLEKYSGVITEYEKYISFMKSNLEEHNKTTNFDLNVQMNEMYESYTDFNACIRDVNLNIQNFVFKDVFKHKNQKRIVKDVKYLTIETLLLKHKDKLNREYK